MINRLYRRFLDWWWRYSWNANPYELIIVMLIAGLLASMVITGILYFVASFVS